MYFGHLYNGEDEDRQAKMPLFLIAYLTGRNLLFLMDYIAGTG